MGIIKIREAQDATLNRGARSSIHKRQDEKNQDAMTNVEVKATSAKTGMDIADAPDEIMVQNARREVRIRNNTARNAQKALDDGYQDEEAIRKAFGCDAREVVQRIPNEVVGADEHAKDSAGPYLSFRWVKRRKRDYDAVLGLRLKNTT